MKRIKTKKQMINKSRQSSIANCSVLGLFLIALLISCDSSPNEGFRRIDGAKVDNTKGATALQNGDYASAIEHFKHAISSATSNADRATGYVGLAFAQFRSSDTNWDGALANLDEAIKNESNNNDALAGKALIGFSQSSTDYSQAIADAQAVLNAEANFEMTLDTRVDHNDLWLIIALAHFYGEDYAASLAAVQHVDGQSSFTADTNSSAGQQSLADRIDSLISTHRQ